MLRFHHTNSEEINLSIKYDQSLYKKPRGLWYDIDCSWSDWCQSNECDNFLNHFSLDVDMEDVLVIDASEKLTAFHTEYNYVPDHLKYHFGDFRRIDWARVSKYYSGIEIAPYFEAAAGLGGYDWYSGWDVACGCIWDLSVIKSISKVDVKVVNDLLR